jgi:hypothetical protein
VPIAGICAEASAGKLVSAPLLDHLHQCAANVSGDQRNRSLVQRFLHAATIPYFKMVTAWISSGELRDMFEEFMVQEIVSSTAVCQDAGAWERRFTLRTRDDRGTPDVPCILEPVADAVLQAGIVALDWGSYALACLDVTNSAINDQRFTPFLQAYW